MTQRSAASPPATDYASAGTSDLFRGHLRSLRDGVTVVPAALRDRWGRVAADSGSMITVIDAQLAKGDRSLHGRGTAPSAPVAEAAVRDVVARRVDAHLAAEEEALAAARRRAGGGWGGDSAKAAEPPPPGSVSRLRPLRTLSHLLRSEASRAAPTLRRHGVDESDFRAFCDRVHTYVQQATDRRRRRHASPAAAASAGGVSSPQERHNPRRALLRDLEAASTASSAHRAPAGAGTEAPLPPADSRSPAPRGAAAPPGTPATASRRGHSGGDALSRGCHPVRASASAPAGEGLRSSPAHPRPTASASRGHASLIAAPAPAPTEAGSAAAAAAAEGRWSKRVREAEERGEARARHTEEQWAARLRAVQEGARRREDALKQRLTAETDRVRGAARKTEVALREQIEGLQSRLEETVRAHATALEARDDRERREADEWRRKERAAVAEAEALRAELKEVREGAEGTEEDLRERLRAADRQQRRLVDEARAEAARAADRRAVEAEKVAAEAAKEREQLLQEEAQGLRDALHRAQAEAREAEQRGAETARATLREAESREEAFREEVEAARRVAAQEVEAAAVEHRRALERLRASHGEEVASLRAEVDSASAALRTARHDAQRARDELASREAEWRRAQEEGAARAAERERKWEEEAEKARADATATERDLRERLLAAERASAAAQREAEAAAQERVREADAAASQREAEAAREVEAAAARADSSRREEVAAVEARWQQALDECREEAEQAQAAAEQRWEAQLERVVREGEEKVRAAQAETEELQEAWQEEMQRRQRAAQRRAEEAEAEVWRLREEAEHAHKTHRVEQARLAAQAGVLRLAAVVARRPRAALDRWRERAAGATVEEECDRLRGAVERFASDLAQADETLDSLRHDLSAAEARAEEEAAAAAASREEAQRLREAMDSSRAEAAGTEDALVAVQAEAHAQSSRVEELDLRARAAEDELAYLRERCEEVEGQAAEREAHWAEKLRVAEAEHGEAVQRAEAAQAEAEAARARGEEAEEEAEEARRREAAARERCAESTQQLSEAQTALSHAQEAERRAAAAKAEAEAEARSARDASHAAEARAGDARRELSEGKKQLERLQEKLEARDAELANAQSTSAIARAELNSVRSLSQDERDQLVSLQRQVRQAELEVDSATHRERRLRGQMELTEADLRDARNTVHQLRAQLHERGLPGAGTSAGWGDGAAAKGASAYEASAVRNSGSTDGDAAGPMRDHAELTSRKHAAVGASAENASASGARAVQRPYRKASGVAPVSAVCARAACVDAGVLAGAEDPDWQEEARRAGEALEDMRSEVASLRTELSEATVRAEVAEATVKAANDEQQRLAARLTEREAEVDQLRVDWLSAARESQALAQERDAARSEAREAAWLAQRATEAEEARTRSDSPTPAPSPVAGDAAAGAARVADAAGGADSSPGSSRGVVAPAEDAHRIRRAVAASEAAAAARERPLRAHVRELGSLLEESRRELARLRYAAGEEELPGASTVVSPSSRRQGADAGRTRSLVDANPASRASPPLHEVGGSSWGSPLLAPETPAPEARSAADARTWADAGVGATAPRTERAAGQADRGEGAGLSPVGDRGVEEGAGPCHDPAVPTDGALRLAEARGREEGRKSAAAEVEALRVNVERLRALAKRLQQEQQQQQERMQEQQQQQQQLSGEDLVAGVGAAALNERPLGLRVAAELCASQQDARLKVRALCDALRARGGDVDEALAAAGLGPAHGVRDPLRSAGRAFHARQADHGGADDAGSALAAATEAVSRLRRPVGAAVARPRPHSEPRRRPGRAPCGSARVPSAAQDAWQRVQREVWSPASARRLQGAGAGDPRGTVAEEAQRAAAAARGWLGKGQAAVLQHGSMRELRRWSADLVEALERCAEQLALSEAARTSALVRTQEAEGAAVAARAQLAVLRAAPAVRSPRGGSEGAEVEALPAASTGGSGTRSVVAQTGPRSVADTGTSTPHTVEANVEAEQGSALAAGLVSTSLPSTPVGESGRGSARGRRGTGRAVQSARRGRRDQAQASEEEVARLRKQVGDLEERVRRARSAKAAAESRARQLAARAEAALKEGSLASERARRLEEGEAEQRAHADAAEGLLAQIRALEASSRARDRVRSRRAQQEGARRLRGGRGARGSGEEDEGEGEEDEEEEEEEGEEEDEEGCRVTTPTAGEGNNGTADSGGGKGGGRRVRRALQFTPAPPRQGQVEGPSAHSACEEQLEEAVRRREQEGQAAMAQERERWEELAQRQEGRFRALLTRTKRVVASIGAEREAALADLRQTVIRLGEEREAGARWRQEAHRLEQCHEREGSVLRARLHKAEERRLEAENGHEEMQRQVDEATQRLQAAEEGRAEAERRCEEAEQRHEKEEQRRAEAEQGRAEAEQRLQEAGWRVKAAEEGRAEAERRCEEAEQRHEKEEQRRAEAEQGRAEAKRRCEEAEQRLQEAGWRVKGQEPGRAKADWGWEEAGQRRKEAQRQQQQQQQEAAPGAWDTLVQPESAAVGVQPALGGASAPTPGGGESIAALAGDVPGGMRDALLHLDQEEPGPAGLEGAVRVLGGEVRRLHASSEEAWRRAGERVRELEALRSELQQARQAGQWEADSLRRAAATEASELRRAHSEAMARCHELQAELERALTGRAAFERDAEAKKQLVAQLEGRVARLARELDGARVAWRHSAATGGLHIEVGTRNGGQQEGQLAVDEEEEEQGGEASDSASLHDVSSATEGEEEASPGGVHPGAGTRGGSSAAMVPRLTRSAGRSASTEANRERGRTDVRTVEDMLQPSGEG